MSSKRDIASPNGDSQQDIVKAFGERVAERVAYYDLPDAYFAKKAGISTSQFALLKAGERLPRADALFQLADALSVTPSWLMRGDAAAGTSLVEANEAEWVQIPRFSLSQLTDQGKGEPLERIPYRKDWLYRRLGSSSGLWITELPSDYDDLGLEEGDAILCSDIEKQGPAEKWICIFRGNAGPFVARYSNRGGSELDSPDATFVTAADLQGGEVFPVARIRARMLARV